MTEPSARAIKRRQLKQLRTLAATLEAHVQELLADVTTLEAAITTMRRRYPAVTVGKDVLRARVKRSGARAKRKTL